MVDSSNKDLDTAIQALSRAIEAIEQRTGTIEQTIADLTQRRQEYLTHITEQLLWDFSKGTLENLRSEVPGFVTKLVRQSFETNKKFLGVYAGATYKRNLTMLQTRLASYLDQEKYGQLEGLDLELTQFAEDKKTLEARITETHELLKVMQKVRKQHVVLPAAVQQHVSQIVKTMRSGHAPKSSGLRASNYSHYASQQNSDFDLLFYLTTDIPTSFRTMMMSALTDASTSRVEAGGGSFGGGGASGDYSTSRNDGVDCGPGDFSGGASALTSAGLAVGVGVGAAAVAECVIATDDRLGAFS